MPGGFKSGYPERLRTTDGPPRDERVEEFFGWLAPIVEAGHGLYLWA